MTLQNFEYPSHKRTRKRTRAFVLLQKRTKSDIGCLDEKELVSEIVGMTNTEGGVLYLGVEDNGDITGVHKKHKDPNGANIVGYVRQTGIDAVKYEAWIMELLQKQGGKITRDNVVELLNVTPSQAYRLLKKCLIRAGLVTGDGSFVTMLGCLPLASCIK